MSYEYLYCMQAIAKSPILSPKVTYEPVKLEQNYRDFDFESPWEGTKYIKELNKKNIDDKKK